jgi:hypothetical protein
MKILKRYEIGTQTAPGELVLCEAYGQHYVAYQALSGSNFRRTRYLDEKAAGEAFSHIIATENWNGVVHDYA